MENPVEKAVHEAHVRCKVSTKKKLEKYAEQNMENPVEKAVYEAHVRCKVSKQKKNPPSPVRSKAQQKTTCR